MPNEPQQANTANRPRIGRGLEGRAVYLEAVAQWLAERDEIALQDARGRLLDTLAGPAPCVVHHLQPGSAGYGEPLPVRDEWFATSDGAPGPAGGRRVFSRGIDQHTPPPARAPSLGRGAAGFVAWLRHVRRDFLPGLIVAESEARRLWGWGAEVAPIAKVPGSVFTLAVVPKAVHAAKPEPATDENGKRIRWKNQFEEWTGERLAEKRRELALGGRRDGTKQLSSLTGLPNREITDREAKWRAEQADQQSKKVGRKNVHGLI